MNALIRLFSLQYRVYDSLLYLVDAEKIHRDNRHILKIIKH